MRLIDGWRAWLDQLGFERVRRTVAALALAFFVILYFLVSLAVGPEWRPAFVGLSLCYLTGFLAIGSEWFWGRWFASGLGWSGAMVGIYALVMVGWVPFLAFYAGIHALVIFMLKGEKVAALYEGQPGWRERYKLDDHGAARLGKTVTRASGSLPAVVIWALGPKQPQGLFGDLGSIDDVGALGSQASSWWLLLVPALVVLGLWLLLRMRSAGLFVLVGGALLGLLGALISSATPTAALAVTNHGFAWTLPGVGTMGAVFLFASLLPFVGPVARYVGAAQARS